MLTRGRLLFLPVPGGTPSQDGFAQRVVDWRRTPGSINKADFFRYFLKLSPRGVSAKCRQSLSPEVTPSRDGCPLWGEKVAVLFRSSLKLTLRDFSLILRHDL